MKLLQGGKPSLEDEEVVEKKFSRRSDQPTKSSKEGEKDEEDEWRHTKGFALRY